MYEVNDDNKSYYIEIAPNKFHCNSRHLNKTHQFIIFSLNRIGGSFSTLLFHWSTFGHATYFIFLYGHVTFTIVSIIFLVSISVYVVRVNGTSGPTTFHTPSINPCEFRSMHPMMDGPPLFDNSQMTI